MHRLRHPIATFIVAVLVVIGAGVGIVSGTGGLPLPGLSAGLIAAVNAMGTDLRITPVSYDAASITVSEDEAVTLAVKNNADPGTSVLAAQVVQMRSVQYPEGALVWVVQFTPSGRSGGVGPAETTPYNFDIQIVNAKTGQWIEGFGGYSPDL
jgi:hypothetical protein